MAPAPADSIPRPAPRALLIGGTAAYGLDLAPYGPVDAAFVLDTPFGPSPVLTLLQPDPAQPPAAFCSRHGPDQLARSAAFVNHRALIWAAGMLGVAAIFSWNGTGAIAGDLAVGDLVIPDDFLDFTRTRRTSFEHANLTSFQIDAPPRPPFHPAARAALLPAARRAAATVHAAGVYVCTEGPRLETAAEIAQYHRCGADLVGMTLSPELFLAQELDIPYASLCFITNYATGRAGDRPPARQFGPIVAHTCLPILLAAAQQPL